MGLSRNKVAVSEGAAGSPPFYGERGDGKHSLRDTIILIEQINYDDGRSVRLMRVRLACCSILSDQVKNLNNSPHKNGGVAQLGEHLPCKQGVMGSNPIISTSRQCRRPNLEWRTLRSKVITRWQAIRKRTKLRGEAKRIGER